MAEVLEAWYQVDRRGAKEFCSYVHEIKKVQPKAGGWKGDKGYIKFQLPRVLLMAMQKSFNKFLPDQPSFCRPNCPNGDEDLAMLFRLAPKLFGK